MWRNWLRPPRFFSQDRVFLENRPSNPLLFPLAEKIFEIPVTRTQEKTQTGCEHTCSARCQTQSKWRIPKSSSKQCRSPFLLRENMTSAHAVTYAHTAPVIDVRDFSSYRCLRGSSDHNDKRWPTRRDFATWLPERITAPNMGAGGSHPQAEMMQHSPFARPASFQGFFNLAGGFRGRRPRSTTRAQEAVSLIDETLNFFVKATGKDEASMRQQLTSQKREELRAKSRPLESTLRR